MDDIVTRLVFTAVSNIAEVAARDDTALAELSATARASSSTVAAGEARAATATAAMATSMEPQIRKAVGLISTLGLAVGGLTLVLDVVSVKSAVDFNRKMELIRTQAGATQGEVDSLKDSVLNLSVEVATGPEALANALYHIESAGFRGAAAMDTLKQAAITAKIGMADLEETTNAGLAIFKSHIGGVRDATDAYSQMIAVVGTGNMRLADLNEALGTGILSKAAAAGLALRDVGAAEAVLTNQGVGATQGATRLGMAISRMESPAGPAIKALDALGLSQSKLAEDMQKPRGLLVALTDLKQHLDASTQGLAASEARIKQSNAISDIFGGGRGSSVPLALLRSLDELTKKYEAQKKLAGEYGADWEATRKQEAYALAEAEALAEKLSIEFGQVLFPAVVSIAGALDAVGHAADSAFKAWPGMVTTLSALGLGIGGVSLALKAGMVLWAPYDALLKLTRGDAGTAAIAQRAEAGAIAQTGEAAAVATPELGAFAGVQGGLARAQLALAANTLTANGAMLGEGAAAGEAAGGMALLSGALPLVGLGLLATALGVIAYEKSPAFRSAIHDAADGLGKAFRGAVYLAQTDLDALGKALDASGSQIDSWSKTLDQGLFGQQGTAGGGGTVMGRNIFGAGIDLPGSGGTAPSGTGAAIDAIPFVKPIHDVVSALQAEADAHGHLEGKVRKTTEAVLAQVDAGNRQQSAGIQAGNFTAFQAGGSKDLDTYTNALANQVYNSGKEIGHFTALGAEAAIKVKGIADALDQAKLLIMEAAGQWSAALKAETSKDQGIYDDLRAHLILAIAGHLAGTEKLAKQAAAAAIPLLDFGKATSEADKLLRHLLGGHLPGEAEKKQTEKPAVPYGQELSTAASKSFDALAAATAKGGKGIDHLTESAIRAAEKNNAYGTMTDGLRLKVDKAAGNWAGVLADMQKLAQDAVSKARGQLLSDKGPGGDTSRIGRDQKTLDDAQANLDRLNASIKTTIPNFDALSKHAADLATKDLQALALGFKSGSKHLGTLEASALAAAHGSDKWLEALARAQRYLDLHSSDPTVRLAAEKAPLQTAYDKAQAQVTEDINKHGRAWLQDTDVGRAHVNALTSSKAALDKFNKSATDASHLASSTPATFSSQQKTAQTNLDSLMDQWNKATKNGASNADDLGRQALAAARHVKGLGDIAAKHSKFIEDALNRAAKAAETFADMMKKAADALSGRTDDYAKELARGTESTPIPGAGKTVDDQGNIIRTVVTQGNKAIGDIYAAAAGVEHTLQINDRALAVQNAALLTAARNAGDLGRAFDQIANKDASDLDRAWKSLQEHFLTGDGDLATLVNDYKVAAAAKEKETQAVIDAALAVGDFKTALAGKMSQATDTFEQALSGIAIKFHDHATVTQGDIDAGVKARQATERWTQSQWDANFATASLAEKSRMLASTMSAAISRASTMAGATSAVDSANLAVIAQEASMQVSILTAMATDIQDQTAVISAQAAVERASSASYLAALKDQAGIIKATSDLSLAISRVTTYQAPKGSDPALVSAIQAAMDRANAASIQVARDQLQIAIDTRRIDITAANWTAVLARDQLRIAMDKQAMDRENAAAMAIVEMAKLQVAKDSYALAVDQLKLTSDSLVIEDAIASSLGAVTSYEDMINTDLSNIQGDQMAIAADQMTLTTVTAQANQIAAQGLVQMALDQQQLAMDQASSDASTVAGEIRISTDQNTLATDTAAEAAAQQAADQLKATNNTTDAVNAQKDAEIARLQAMVTALEQLVTDSHDAVGARRPNVSGLTTSGLWNGLSGDRAANVTSG